MPGNVPPRSQLVREVLERLILERAQLQLARELGVVPDDTAVDQAVDNVALQNQVSLEELKRRLSVDGVDYARFRADLRDELTLVRLRERDRAFDTGADDSSPSARSPPALARAWRFSTGPCRTARSTRTVG